MVLSRGLVISLGVSALGCTLLFLYFRNKISAVERKVDVMFDLIQNHQQQQSTMNYRYENEVNEQQQEQEQEQQTGVWNNEARSNPDLDLIQVSDEDDEDDDSDEVSDSDDDDDEEEQPKLSLASVEDMSLELSDVKKITVQESDKVLVNDNIELEEVEDSLDEIDDDDEEEDEDEEDEEEKEDSKDTTKKVTVVKEEDEEFDYTKLKVTELKAIAEQKGLEGYKSLKKTPLIDLIKASE